MIRKNRKYRILKEGKNMTRQEMDEFMWHLNRGRVAFKFFKKDGSHRDAIGTLCPALMPSIAEIRKQCEANGVDYDDMMQNMENKKAYMPYYWDLMKGGYRRFHNSHFDGYIELSDIQNGTVDIPGLQTSTLEQIVNDLGTPAATKNTIKLPGSGDGGKSKANLPTKPKLDPQAIADAIKQQFTNGEAVDYKTAMEIMNLLVK